MSALEYFSYIAFFVLGILFLILALFFVLLISRNLQQGKRVRQKIAERVESLRMSKMLKALGLDFTQYLYTVPLHQINDSMNKCEQCATTETCDEKLQQPHIEADEIDFCPNHECLGKFSQLSKDNQ